jgi:hypothetical protein
MSKLEKACIILPPYYLVWYIPHKIFVVKRKSAQILFFYFHEETVVKIDGTPEGKTVILSTFSDSL